MYYKSNLGQRWSAYILLLGFFLQSCHSNAPMPTFPGGDNPAHPPSLSVIDREEETTTGKPALEGYMYVNSTALPRGEKRRNDQELRQESSKKGKKEQNTEIDILNTFPKEVWQHIFSYVPAEHIGNVRKVNRTFYRLTTGYQQPGLVGVANKPIDNINVGRWMNNEWIDFNEGRFEELTPSTIPSLLFYQFLEKVRNLPQPFWPYLKGTHIKEIHLTNHYISASDIAAFAKSLQGTSVRVVDLSGNKIGDLGAQELTKALATLQIHSLHLRDNEIGPSGAQELAKALLESQIHTLYLGENQIGASGSQELAKALPNSQIHTMDLWDNQIGDPGAQELAKALPNSKIHKLVLSGNQIGNSGAQALAEALANSQIQYLDLGYNQIGASGFQELAKALPNSQIHTLDLRTNQIGDSGAQALAKVLPNAKIHTVDLSGNQITPATQKLLREQYPNIKWMFLEV